MPNPHSALGAFLNYKLGVRTRSLFFLVTLTGLYLFYFFRLSPIQNWIHSDLAIPYLMANTPITLEDNIFFWGTNRFAVFYSFLGKCIFALSGHAMSPDLYFHFFSFFYIFCLALLWLLPLNPLFILILLFSFAPTTNLGIQFSLLPGQPHGAVLFLLVATYLAASAKNAWLSILFMLLLFLTYAPGGCLGFAIFLATALQDPSYWKKRWKALMIGGAIGVGVGLFLKIHAVNLQNFSFSLNPDFSEIKASLRILFLEQGLPLDAQGGIIGLGFLLICLATGGYVALRTRGMAERLWGAILFCWSLGGLFFIGMTKWYVYNAHDIRYPAAVSVGSIVLLVIVLQKKLIKAAVVLVPLALLAILKEVPVVHGKISNPTGIVERQEKIYRESLEKGCKGVIGDYWDTMYLGAWSKMRVLGSTIPMSIYSKYHDEVISRRKLCLVDTEHPDIKDYQFSSNLSVTCVQSGNELVRLCRTAAELPR